MISAFKAQRPTVERPGKMETSTGFEPVYTVLQTVTWPLGHDVNGVGEGKGGAEDWFRSLNSSNVGGTSIRAFRQEGYR